MAITGNATYIPTMDEFLAHWLQCNQALGAAPLVVAVPKGPVATLASFSALRLALLTQQQLVQSALNDQQIERARITERKGVLLGLLGQFTGLLSAYFQGSVYFDARPHVPGAGEGQDRFCQPMMDALSLWQKIDEVPGVTLPLVLAEGETVETFREFLEELQEFYREERRAGQAVVLERGTRNRLQDEGYAVMKSYRQAVPPRLVLHPVLVETMPRLTPLPGHTPVPVQVSGMLVAPDRSRLVYSVSADPKLLRYELEGCNGDEYLEEDAVLVASRLPGEEPEFDVQFGLTQPGTAVVFKVFVVLTTGNRAGSAAVVVRRAAEGG